MVFVKKPELLKYFISILIPINLTDIISFKIINSEIPPEILNAKHCRFDLIVNINDILVNLEIQAKSETNFSDRALTYWSRGFSSALKNGMPYANSPKMVTISILNFKLLPGVKFYSRFMLNETDEKYNLTEKCDIRFIELPKLPPNINKFDRLSMLLNVFNAKTKEDLSEIRKIGGKEVKELINTYYDVSNSSEFEELERLRYIARLEEATALESARNEGKAEGIALSDAKWQKVAVEKDAELAEQKAELADKDAKLAEQATELALLRAKFTNNK
jgi:predicted transposase/invertase (TIGR01784 family)